MSTPSFRRIWIVLRSLRWAILALVAGVGGGMLLLTFEEEKPGTDRGMLPPVAAKPSPDGASPWYQAQTPPPVLPNLPDAPIFF